GRDPRTTPEKYQPAHTVSVCVCFYSCGKTCLIMCVYLSVCVRVGVCVCVCVCVLCSVDSSFTAFIVGESAHLMDDVCCRGDCRICRPPRTGCVCVLWCGALVL